MAKKNEEVPSFATRADMDRWQAEQMKKAMLAEKAAAKKKKAAKKK